MLEAFRQWLTNPILYILILPGIGFWTIIVVSSLRGLLRIKSWEYSKAYEQAHRKRYLRGVITALIGLNLFAYPLYKLDFASGVTLLEFFYAVGIGNAFFLYFIVLEIIAIHLARRRVKELSENASTTTPRLPYQRE
jgi:hypothetical protein